MTVNDSQIKSTILASLKTFGSMINADLHAVVEMSAPRIQRRRIIRCANELVSAGLVKMSEGHPNGFGQRKVTWHAI